ncbi:hypothetical protein K504DRAFT_463571 [Pleomassaria siparia CBS 279.74]|uniref:Uncharacterized protein n=1 Tax=Pleomassaria siparia CBS 279.74 TaxID=1314801 RepID=A0A6G1JTH5_9PLEO|nr:hypothetical protein K504DRAFT_463571 [Pleomassaria siparia CBS 279.74]
MYQVPTTVHVSRPTTDRITSPHLTHLSPLKEEGALSNIHAPTKLSPGVLFLPRPFVRSLSPLPFSAPFLTSLSHLPFSAPSPSPLYRPFQNPKLNSSSEPYSTALTRTMAPPTSLHLDHHLTIISPSHHHLHTSQPTPRFSVTSINAIHCPPHVPARPSSSQLSPATQTTGIPAEATRRDHASAGPDSPGL